MTEENKYNLAELKKWLIGDSAEAMAFRILPENLAQVSQMIGEFASLTGGRDAGYVTDRIRAEKRRAQIDAEKALKAKQEKLAQVEAIRLDYLASGGLESVWSKDSVAIVEEFARSGRGRDVVERIHAQRLAKSARTI